MTSGKHGAVIGRQVAQLISTDYFQRERKH